MKLLLLSTCIAGLLPLFSKAQSEGRGVNYVDPQDHDYYSKIAAVYGADRVQNDADLVENLVILLRDRIAYQFEVQSPDEKYPRIGSFPLMNKVNTEMVIHDPSVFDVTTFNPLQYRWDFFSNKIQVFRIDGTDFLLIVQPQ